MLNALTQLHLLNCYTCEGMEHGFLRPWRYAMERGRDRPGPVGGEPGRSGRIRESPILLLPSTSPWGTWLGCGGLEGVGERG